VYEAHETKKHMYLAAWHRSLRSATFFRDTIGNTKPHMRGEDVLTSYLSVRKHKNKKTRISKTSPSRQLLQPKEGVCLNLYKNVFEEYSYR